MKTLDRLRRSGGWVAWLLVVVLVSGTSACTRMIPLRLASPTLGEEVKKSKQVVATLWDRTTARFDRPRLDTDRVLRGGVVRCSGPSCERIVEQGWIRLDEVSGLEGRIYSRGKTATSVTLSVLGGALFVAGIVALVVVMRGSGSWGPTGGRLGSCPHVYSYDGAGWHLDSDTYGMAFFEAMEETDYDLLERLRPVDGVYRLRLANELDETEHTDALALRVVDHPAGTRVVPSQSGELHTFRAEVAPVRATDLRGREVRGLVAARDGVYFQSDLGDRRVERAGDARDGLILDFPKPAGARQAKLWLSGMNTRFASVALGYLFAQMGPRGMKRFRERLKTDAAARRRFFEFMEREGMLSASVWTGRRWEQRGRFWPAGPDARKDQALVLPIQDLAGPRLRVRLEAATAFWTIDAVTADFGPDLPLEERKLTARKAVADDGRDLTATLAAIDGQRYTTEQGERAELVFDAPPAPAPGLARSFVLESTGYYDLHLPPAPRGSIAAMRRVLEQPGQGSQLALALLLNALAADPAAARLVAPERVQPSAHHARP
ncbi:MAG: hypothetical protein IT371_00460 [Deltaproteobacteria bacterium]|nr:hypothetical protein [Deltaproteobacteria bacterium]